MGFVHGGVGEERFVGGDQRQVKRIGQFQELGFGFLLVGLPMAHQLDVETSRECRRQAFDQGLGGVALTVQQQPPDGAERATGQRDQAPAIGLQIL